jgi:tol-pal system protein YbgF
MEMNRRFQGGNAVRRWVVLLSVFLAGCATQANMVDMESELDRINLEKKQLNERLQALEKTKGSPADSRSQTDLALRLDQIAADLQSIQGRLEETSHLVSELSQRMDDQSFRMKEITGRIDTLDQQIALAQDSVGRAVPPGPAETRKGPSAETGSVPRPPDKSVVLPGRSVDKQKGSLSPSEAYGLAYNDYLKGNYDLALMGFQNFLSQFKGTSLSADAQYWIGESYFAKKDYPKAIDAFQRIGTDYPSSNRLPGALLKTGYAYIELGDKERARAFLRQVVQSHPFSNEAKLAKNRLAELK